MAAVCGTEITMKGRLTGILFGFSLSRRDLSNALVMSDSDPKEKSHLKPKEVENSTLEEHDGTSTTRPTSRRCFVLLATSGQFYTNT